MPIAKWTKLSSEVFHENKWWKGIHDRFRLPNGKEGDYYYMSTPGGVSIIPVDTDGKILFLRQYRYIFDQESLECPAGGVKPGNSELETAKAELIEETGKKAEFFDEVGRFAVGSGLLDEMTKVFVARNLSPAFAEKDETEEFELVRLTPEEVDEAILRGEIWDGFSISAWAIAKPYLK
ncbi:TPA: hypothetical protein DEA21_00455 [Candidatus Uhrbacteria bacterium]|nr:hypothetical protein [Candidatus Uhrbacteria bacterium]